jgi:hypothetical protein
MSELSPAELDSFYLVICIWCSFLALLGFVALFFWVLSETLRFGTILFWSLYGTNLTFLSGCVGCKHALRECSCRLIIWAWSLSCLLLSLCLTLCFFQVPHIPHLTGTLCPSQYLTQHRYLACFTDILRLSHRPFFCFLVFHGVITMSY